MKKNGKTLLQRDGVKEQSQALEACRLKSD